jgi:hypothetical protein
MIILQLCNRRSPLTGCYFFCLSKRSNLRQRRISLRLKEKETEIETHVLRQPPHKPKISAGMSSRTETHPATGRNLNARDNTAYPHRHRFPGPRSMVKQRYFNAQSYRNRRRCAAGESPAGFAPKAHPPLAEIPVQLHNSLNLAEVYPHRNFGLCVESITPSVTISASLLWLLFRFPGSRLIGGSKSGTSEERRK